ncbi:hypothetical protein [Blastococcus sp. SYSU D00813]
MDAAVAGVLGAVLLVLAGLLALPLALRRPRPTDPAPAAPVSGARPPAFPDDDLPAFRAAPPGTPGAAPPERRPARVRMAPPVSGADDGDRAAARVLVALAAAALALVAVLALLAGAESGTDDGADPPAGPTAGAAPASSERPVPPLPAVPATPLSGAPGAGALAMLSVPLDDDGWAARLAFAPLVLEPRAVGATVAVPAVGVTRRADGTALAHVRLPTWNCLAAEAPPDPAAAGCAPGPVEYADLPSPALQSTVEEGRLRLTGRFPTYTRPAGGAPVYTGRVYELTVTVSARGRDDGRSGWAPAEGTLFLGLTRAESVDDPALSAVRRGG